MDEEEEEEDEEEVTGGVDVDLDVDASADVDEDEEEGIGDTDGPAVEVGAAVIVGGERLNGRKDGKYWPKSESFQVVSVVAIETSAPQSVARSGSVSSQGPNTLLTDE